MSICLYPREEFTVTISKSQEVSTATYAIIALRDSITTVYGISNNNNRVNFSYNTGISTYVNRQRRKSASKKLIEKSDLRKKEVTKNVEPAQYCNLAAYMICARRSSLYIIYTIPASLLLINLFFYHLKMILSNRTTYEDIQGMYAQDNPFDEGKIETCLSAPVHERVYISI
ncbi:palmitoyltransferase, putative [Plasmodium ovale wallikeri]|uniref:Palmitoyltransferase, putative n=1 Tax=Plasmodium ovale wallikeri TaxID=864142 RepID=A0A1A8ZV93_PLAOA|nr:palmitoyltransferase, putative [Plasmodium ovale wallikeri]